MSKENRDFLDEHFAENQPEQEEAETPETPEAEQEAAAGKVEEVQKPAAEQAAEVTTTPEAKEAGAVPLAALMAERDKRQKLEKELEELRKQAPKEQPPTYFEDPEAYVQRVQSESNQRLYAALEEGVREQHPDYDEVFAVVMQHAVKNPAVAAEVMAAPNPALAAYRMGKKLAEFDQMQDPEAYRAKLEAELRTKWEAEQAAKVAQRQKVADEIPPDLSQARNTRGEFAASTDIFTDLFERK